MVWQLSITIMLLERMTTPRLIYLPFGGAGEIGMNMYVYGYGSQDGEQFIVVDAGVLFPDMETAPGVDLIIPDFSWLVERKSQVEAIFITHGHLDHLGAISFLTGELDVPVYAREFSRQIALDRIYEYGGNQSRFHTVDIYPDKITAGPFEVSYVPISHSIPESSSLIIDTPDGRVIHTGDFKLDHEPVIGEPFEEELWEEICSEKILALICDSTNALTPGKARSEASIGTNLDQLIQECEGMVIATTFASHIARIYQIAQAAELCGRNVVLLGRAMNRLVSHAIEVGILEDLPNQVSIEQARNLPRNSLLVLATGSQGEGRAATAQLSTGGSFRGLRVKRGDTVIYSSKTIPGNEVAISKIQNRFAELGVNIIDESSGLYHVSGHPNKTDLEKLHKLVLPNLVIPMHGEYRHLKMHAEIAIDAGFNAIVAPNGSMVELLRGKLLDSEKEQIGRLCIDGNDIVEFKSDTIKERLRMAHNGLVSIFLSRKSGRFNREGIIVQCSGLNSDAFEEFQKELISMILTKLSQSTKQQLAHESKLKDILGKATRKLCLDFYNKKPVIQIAIR